MRRVGKEIDAHRGIASEYKAKSIVTKMKNDAINKAAAEKLLQDPSATVTVANADDDDAPPLHRYMTNDSTMTALA